MDEGETKQLCDELNPRSADHVVSCAHADDGDIGRRLVFAVCAFASKSLATCELNLPIPATRVRRTVDSVH
jgi:hypothetical protein